MLAITRHSLVVTGVSAAKRSAVVKMTRKLDNSDLVSTLKLPVLFLMGDAERTATPKDVEKLMQSLPDADVTEFVFKATNP